MSGLESVSLVSVFLFLFFLAYFTCFSLNQDQCGSSGWFTKIKKINVDGAVCWSLGARGLGVVL